MPRNTRNRSLLDSDFDKFEKRFDRLFGFGLVMVVIGWILSLSLLVAAIWVAVHFLSKVW